MYTKFWWEILREAVTCGIRRGWQDNVIQRNGTLGCGLFSAG